MQRVPAQSKDTILVLEQSHCKAFANSALLLGFADFAEAPEPSPASISAATAAASMSSRSPPTLIPDGRIPYTKWYRVWERTTLSDFKQELIIMPFLIAVLLIHLLGAQRNKRKVNAWAAHHVPPLRVEFAQVGFERPVEDLSVADDSQLDTAAVLRENSKSEYATYASGRNNVAFLDAKITLKPWHNPVVVFAEGVLGLIFDATPATIERMEATAYAFDNKESALAPAPKGQAPPKSNNSSFDGFVFAVIHKRMLRRIREDRYDLSLTQTKDHPKLPAWTTVLSENGEITELLLTADLTKAIEDAGDLFDALVISDQPIEKPVT
jgi:hypothetical protein